MTDYVSFLDTKIIAVPDHGPKVTDDQINPILFDFQRDLTRWAVRKARCAIFADTGLGKTFMQLEWARLTEQRTLIVAPLAVAEQTVDEAHKLDMNVKYARHPEDAAGHRHVITNYEIVDRFDPADFGAVVLDESSILKNYTGKTRTQLIRQFAGTQYRLACTATPAPNDIAEIANHAEYLGVMSRVEMLAAFFVHDQDGWRLKGHAREPFYRWMASWGMAIRKPSDLGYSDNGFDLPPLNIDAHLLPVEWTPDGQLFSIGLSGITERASVRRDTLESRCKKAAQLVEAEPDEQWLLWVGLNDESDALSELLPDAEVVEGAHSPEHKADVLRRFAAGQVRTLITKPSIAGFGLNFQTCARMAFVGLGDSYEQYYQAIRRCWRFGQTRPVDVHVVLSEPEQAIYNNVLQKEATANEASAGLVRNVAQYELEELMEATHHATYIEDEAAGDRWTMKLGDSCERLTEIEDESVGLAVFSPPFESLYTYSPSERDLGNSATSGQFWEHFSWVSDNLLRTLKPGRLAAVHVQQIPTTKMVEGYIGLRDFRGDTIRHFIERGFIYHGEICIDKDPQAQAIRTKAKSLMFVQLEKDSSWMRPAFGDYIILMRKPGENPEVIETDVTRDEWIQYARPIWYNIRESDTLNVAEARSNDDERHIAPLQLETIRRCVRLWSNKDDLILSPFAGIGSEGFVAVQEGRRFVGIELKPEYWKTGVKNLGIAEQNYRTGTLLDFIHDDDEAQP